MHKYFEKKPPKIKQTKTQDDDDDLRSADDEEGEAEIEDGSLDAFADQVIEDKMKELNRGAGLNEDSEDDELMYSDADDEEGESEAAGDDDEFFDG